MAQVIKGEGSAAELYFEKKKKEQPSSISALTAAALLGATAQSAVSGRLETLSGSSSSKKSSYGSGYSASSRYPTYTDPIFHSYSAAYTPYKYSPYDAASDADYQNALRALGYIEKEKPAYVSSYGDKLSALESELENRPAFTYDLYTDPLYLQARDEYAANGALAMRDAMGRAADLSGGYGSSHAAASGQQAYNSSLRQLNSIVPELYESAYERWKEGEADLQRRYALTKELSDDEYKEYRDALGDWEKNRSYYSKAAQEAYNRGYELWSRGETEKSKKSEREYKAMLADIEAMAKYGDFSGYAWLYGEDAAREMYRNMMLMKGIY